MKRNTLIWYGHNERMESEEFVKKVYVGKRVGSNSSGRPLGRWKDRVKEYMCERGATGGGELEQARREYLDTERWRFFCLGYLLGECFWQEQEVRTEL